MNRDSGNNIGGGVIAFFVAVIGIVLLAIFGPKGGLLSTILKVAGIACIVIAVVVVALIVFAIVAAAAANKEDGKGESKVQTRRMINAKKQQLAKLKSRAALLKDSEYAAEMQKSIAELEQEIAELELRRNAALAKMTVADAREISLQSTDDSSLKELEEEAQYRADYTEALKQLEK